MSYEINLIEGERGKLHVTSDDIRTEHALMFGTGRKVLNMDDSFEASMTDSNAVRITSGVLYNNGMFIRIDRDRYVELTIDNGLPGTYRHDLICIRYERDIQTQLESASIVVKKGEASETKAEDPKYTVGDVLDLEVHLDEFPLYRVALDGMTAKLEPLFVVEDVISNTELYNDLMEHLEDTNNPAGNKHIPEGGSSGQILRWSADGKAVWGNEKHPTTSKSTDSTSTASPSAGSTFTAVDSVTRDNNGHVTKVNTKTVTLPKTAVVVDDQLSDTSENPVQNKVINAEINKLKQGTYFAYCYTASDEEIKEIRVAETIDYPKKNTIYAYFVYGNTAKTLGIKVIDGDGNGWVDYCTSPGIIPSGSIARLEYNTYNDVWAIAEVYAGTITNSSAINTTGLYALDAIEKNASIQGTMANEIAKLNTYVPLEIVTSSNIAGGTRHAYRIGNVCQVYGYVVMARAGEHILAFTIPDATPIEQTIFPLTTINGVSAIGRIETTGEVLVSLPSSCAAVGMVFNFNYITAS